MPSPSSPIDTRPSSLDHKGSNYSAEHDAGTAHVQTIDHSAGVKRIAAIAEEITTGLRIYMFIVSRGES